MESYSTNNYCGTPRRDFVSVDIEYADRAQNICQLGLAVVRNLQITERRSWLIQPPGNRYEELQMRIHGITPDMTADAPSFPEAWEEIEPYIRDAQLWAHNAFSVEQPILDKNLTVHHIPHDYIRILDSRELYRRPDFPANRGNGLAQCCMAMGIPCANHHDAGADAEMCALLVIAAAEGRRPSWDGVPASEEELRKQQQEKRVLRLGDFREYYAGNSSGEEDVFAVISSTCEGSPEYAVDVFDKGDIIKDGNPLAVDFSRLNTGDANPLRGRKVVLTGLFRYDRKDIEKAIAAMGAKKVQKPSKNTDAVILGTRNVGFTKLIGIEELEETGHHMARIVGDADLEELLYGDGSKFFNW